jgi:subtilisin family serine protease
VLIVAGASLVPSAANAAGRPSDRYEPLCGIARPVDAVLRCDETVAPGPARDQSAPAAAPLPEEQPHVVTATPRYVDDLLLVKFHREVSLPDQQDLFRRAGVTAVRHIANLDVAVVQMPADHRDAALAELRKSTLVLNAERDAVMERLDTTPNDTNWSLQWGLRQANFPTAWDRTRGLDSVVVAVLDTGVNSDLPDMQGITSATVDDNGHGTSVAGIIAARTNNHAGIAGSCWTCSILPIKVLAADGTGDTSLVAAGIVRAADAGARVISMSLGGPADNETLDQAVGYALSKGAILVAAAGNNGTSAPFYPAAIPGVIGVAATDQSDHLYSWSNYGSWVKLAAPGCNPAPSSTGGYVLFCGTSSAVPLVAGLVALALSAQPNAGSNAIISAIQSTTVPIGSTVNYGRIDAAAALNALTDAPLKTTLPSASPASVSIATFRGKLTQRTPERWYRQPVRAGLVTATLGFTGRRELTLSIRDRSGALVGQVTGRSPLQLARKLPSGTFQFSVSGRKPKTTYELMLSGKAPG